MKSLISALALAFLPAATCSAVVYAIDIDTQRLGASDTSSTINTASGFASLDVTTNAQTASVIVGGINFSLGSVVGFANSRNRGLVDNLTDLTRDFVYEDGANAAIIMYFGGAGSLPAGTWQLEIWASDTSGIPINDQIIGLRTNTTESIQTTTFAGSQTDPFTFTFESDGVAAYDVFVRENSTSNRARLNAVRLTSIPEPASTALLFGALGIFFSRRCR